MPTRRAIRQFEDKARRTQHETGQKRRDCPSTIQPWPQNSQNKAGGNWWADVGLHALQINVELAADVMNKRNPKQSKQHHEAGGNASKINKLLLGSHGANLFVKIQRHECGRRVENRTHCAHDRREQSRHHQPDEARGKQIQDERWIRKVGLLHLLGEKRESDDAGQDQHENRKYFEKARAAQSPDPCTNTRCQESARQKICLSMENPCRWTVSSCGSNSQAPWCA